MKRKGSSVRRDSKSAKILDPKSILVPIDFSPTSIHALKSASRFAQRFGAQLTVVHVVEPAPFLSGLETVPLTLSDEEVRKKAKAELTDLTRRVVADAVTATTIVRSGKPFQEIARLAQQLKTDLIILSTHGYTGLQHTLMGSTAERVVRHAPCAVLVVR